jgi:hypothetical protein
LGRGRGKAQSDSRRSTGGRIQGLYDVQNTQMATLRKLEQYVENRRSAPSILFASGKMLKTSTKAGQTRIDRGDRISIPKPANSFCRRGPSGFFRCAKTPKFKKA